MIESLSAVDFASQSAADWLRVVAAGQRWPHDFVDKQPLSHLLTIAATFLMSF